MIHYAGAIFLVVGFIWIFKAFGLVEKSTRVIDISRRAVSDLRDDSLDDDAKESAMQAYAKQLLALFFLITIGGIAAVLLPVAVIWGLDRLQLLSYEAVLGVALSWTFLVATTVLICIAVVIARKR